MTSSKYIIFLFCTFALLQSRTTGAQELSLRTNLLWDAVSEPNLGVEWKTGEHWSIGLNGGLKPWPRWLAWDWDAANETHWRNFIVSPEARYYVNEVFKGFFVGADAVYTHYNVGRVSTPFSIYPDVENYRLQGDFLGLGLFAGHSWWLGKSNWRMEVAAGAMAGYVRADKYECSHCGARVGEAPKAAVVPQLAVNLAYTIRKKTEAVPEVIPPMPDTLLPPVPVPEPEPFRLEPIRVEEWKGVAGELAPKHPVLKPSSEYIPYTPDRILRKEEGALYVFFELDKSVLRRSFTEKTGTRDNGPVLDEILHITQSILADTTSSVSCIQIIGLASIEGRQDRNAALSVNRAKALQDYIQNALDVPDSVFETIGGGEAWTEFRDQVNDLIQQGGGAMLTREQLQKVMDIMDGEPNPDRREWRIKKLENGAIYRQLSKHILSEQRNSGYIRVYFDYVPDEGAKTINQAIEALENGHPEEALNLLEPVKNDPRCRAARARALLDLGREEEAAAILSSAASEGDEKAKEYLRTFEKHRAEQREYQKYLQALNEYNQSINR